jgi:hypothetical protein
VSKNSGFKPKRTTAFELLAPTKAGKSSLSLFSPGEE